MHYSYSREVEVPYMQINGNALLGIYARAHNDMLLKREDWVSANSVPTSSKEATVEFLFDQHAVKENLYEEAVSILHKKGFWNRSYNRYMRSWLRDQPVLRMLKIFEQTDDIRIEHKMDAINAGFKTQDLDEAIAHYNATVERSAEYRFDHKIQALADKHDRLLAISGELSDITFNLTVDDFEDITESYIDNQAS